MVHTHELSLPDLTRVALVVVGAMEAAAAAWVIACPGHALPSVVGRTLAVGASATTKSLVAQHGALRFALALFVVLIGVVIDEPDISRKLAVVATAQICVLQPLVLATTTTDEAGRAVTRLPVGGRLWLLLLEGAAITAAIGADVSLGGKDGEGGALYDSPVFLASSSFWLVGLILCLGAYMQAAVGSAAPSPVESREPSEELADALLFDENRHRLSPQAKRLLS